MFAICGRMRGMTHGGGTMIPTTGYRHQICWYSRVHRFREQRYPQARH